MTARSPKTSTSAVGVLDTFASVHYTENRLHRLRQTPLEKVLQHRGAHGREFSVELASHMPKGYLRPSLL